MKEKKEIIHYQYCIKCVACSLHFIVLSWKKNWVEEVKCITCPECSHTDKCMVLKKISSKKQIFEFV